MPRKSANPARVVVGLFLFLALGIGSALFAAFPGGGRDAVASAGVVPVAGPGPTAPGAAGAAAPKPTASKLKPGEPAGSLRGSVRLYRTKEPVAGLALELRAPGREPLRLETNADGAFATDGLPVGADYELAGEMPPYAPIALTGVAIAAQETTDLGVLWLAVPVELRAEVIDVTGAPVPQADVLVFAVAREASDEGGWWAAARERRILALPTIAKPTKQGVTDAAGRATVAGLMPGTYRVEAAAEGYASESKNGVVLAPDAAPAPVRLVLGPGHDLAGLVIDEFGKPVAAAKVIATRGEAWQPGLDKWIAESGEDGAYRLRGLPAGRVTLYLERTGKPLLQVGSAGIPDTQRFDIRLRPGGTIRGTVTDEEGKPVEGADVRTAMQNTWCPMAVKTDKDGLYTLVDVPAGPLGYFRVTADGYMPHPDPSAPQQGAGESLREGAVMVRDVMLRRGLSAEVTVLADADGAPVAGAEVVLHLARQWGGQTPPFRGQSDGAGKAAVGGLVPGEYLVVVNAEGYVQEGLPPWYMNLLQSPEAMPKPYRLTALGAGPFELTCRLTRGATVSGRVLDARGQAVSGANVTVLHARNEYPVFTDGEGRYEVAAVPPSLRCTASATAPGHAPGESEPFVVEAGAAVKDIEIKLAAGGRVTGHVRSPDGRPLVGAVVRWVAGQLEANNPWAFQQFDHAERFPVAPDGRFEVTGVPAGAVTVRADAEGFLPAWSTGVQAYPDQETGGVQLLLTTPYEIRGRVEAQGGGPVAGAQVYAQYTGTREEQVWGFVSGLGGNPSAQSDSEGNFVVKGLKQGNYTLWSQAPGFASGSRVQTATDAGEVLIVLARGKAISGIVKDEAGQGLGGVPVSAQRTDSQQREDWWWWGGNAFVYTAPDGTFEMKDLAEGTYQLVVSAMWQWGRDVNVEDTTLEGVSAGRDDVEIVVKSGKVIEGRLVDREKRPVAVGWISAQFQPGSNRENQWRNQRWTQVRADGTFRVVGLAAGSYTLWAYGSSFQQKQQQGVAAGSTGVEIEVEPGFAIAGRLTDRKGLAVASGFNVQVRRSGTENWEWRNTITPGDGTFVVLGLSEGSFDLRVQVEGFVPAQRTDVLAGTSDLRIVLEQGFEIAGSVAGPDGAPVEGAWVGATQIGAAAGSTPVGVNAQTDAAGRFRLTGLAQGEYRLVVRAQNLAPRTVPSVAAGSENQLLTLEVGETITGSVVDAGGQPLARARLELRDEDGTQLGSTRADASGLFTFRNVPSGGRWKLAMRHWDGRTWQQAEHPDLVDSGAADVVFQVK